MDNLQKDVKFLKGVGEKRAELLRKLNINTMEHLLFHIPRDYINRKNRVPISSLIEGEYASFIAKIQSLEEIKKGSRKSQFQMILSDGEDSLICLWFKYADWLIEKFQIGQEVWVSGTITVFFNKFQIVHPEIEIIDESSDVSDFWKQRSILPIYPLTQRLKMNFLRNIIVQLFTDYHQFIEETLPENIETKFKFESRYVSLQRIHFPSDMNKTILAKKRFAFEELFYHQLMMARTNHYNHSQNKGIVLATTKTLTTRLKNRLNFELTNAQKKVVREIFVDMKSGNQMNRLLQGDVGSGKTIVTLFAMLLTIENGYQAILVAPTEILAEQHFKSISNYLKDEEINIVMLKGGNYKGKKQVKEEIKNGIAQIVIGTHALFQKDVNFKSVGFVAIDEQHRFGVEQRSVLIQKNNFPHLLYMSATPIPRSLALTFFGDLDVSVIDELPPTRKSVKTVWRSESKIHYVYEEIRKELECGRQAYFVCPLIEESEKIQLKNAESVQSKLQNDVFPEFKIALLHGKMKNAEKDAIMTAFKNKEFQVLVSTTVIEVGIDVPNASVMVIEQAERFGLSQLHQLRGRVGRGADAAFCYLIAYPPVSKEGRERLNKMVETNDGFAIAEKDLEIRGPGDFFGTMQSGLPSFKFANLVKDQELLRLARSFAFEMIEEDNSLAKYPRIRKRYFSTFVKKEKFYHF